MIKKYFSCLLPAALALTLLAGCAAKTAAPYEPGAWNGEVYTSSFIGLTFTLPQGWTRSDDETLAAMDQEAEAALQAQQEGKQPREATYHYALQATGGDQGVTVLVQRSDMSAKNYVSALKSGAETEGAGFTVGDAYEQTLGGQRYTAIPVTVEGNATTQRQYVRAIDGYFINVMLFAAADDDFAALESAFSSSPSLK